LLHLQQFCSKHARFGCNVWMVPRRPVPHPLSGRPLTAAARDFTTKNFNQRAVILKVKQPFERYVVEPAQARWNFPRRSFVNGYLSTPRSGSERPYV
jgi:hypothetical protein